MIVAITPGLERGIGPKVMLEAVLMQSRQKKKHLFYWCLDKDSLISVQKKYWPGSLLKIDNNLFATNNGHVIKTLGDGIGQPCLDYRQAFALKESVSLARKKSIDFIATGPISKKALISLGDFNGQTEYFSHHLNAKGQQPFMAFLGGPFMLSLLTTHVPLNDVAKKIDQKLLFDHLSCINKIFPNKKVFVLGLNPHAGEHGLLGLEEKTIIEPVIKEIQKNINPNIYGPISADGFFNYFHLIPKEKRPDIVVSCFHDQGLCAYKILAKGKAVNFTFGLTLPRVSPAHGTAEDLADKSFACFKSASECLKKGSLMLSLYPGGQERFLPDNKCI